MTVKPLLGEREIPHITFMGTRDQRAFVELAVPGRAGSLYQDLDASPTRIVITGSLYGDENRNQFLEQVRGQHRAGSPVTFVADILTATDLQYVVIEALDCQQSAGRPEEISYRIVLRESPPPPPPPSPLAGLDTGLLDQARDLADSAAGLLDAIDALGSVPALKDPTPPLEGILGGVKSALDGIQGASGLLEDLFGTGE
jgi:hypothetical protein